MKILVTGGAGFIGSNLVDRLIAEGHSVVIVDDLSTGKIEYLNPQAKFYQLDVCDAKLADVFVKESFDYVFHLAAQMDVRVSMADPVLDNKVNILGSLNLFNNCFKNKIKKIIFFSTGGAIYGSVSEPADEKTLPNPDSPYAVDKYAAEKYLEIFAGLHDAEYLILRPANVYGPRQYKGGEGAVIATFTYNALNDLASKVFGDGLQTRDYIYVEDVVDGVLAAILSDKKGVYNIGRGEKVSVLDLLKIIGQAVGREMKYGLEPRRPGEVQDSVLDISKIKKELNWQPKHDLKTGIAKTIEWLRKK